VVEQLRFQLVHLLTRFQIRMVKVLEAFLRLTLFEAVLSEDMQ
jgi:hypothetical protein